MKLLQLFLFAAIFSLVHLCANQTEVANISNSRAVSFRSKNIGISNEKKFDCQDVNSNMRTASDALFALKLPVELQADSYQVVNTYALLSTGNHTQVFFEVELRPPCSLM